MVLAQPENKYNLMAGADIYFNYNFNKTLSNTNDYFVSHHLNKKLSANLLYAGINRKTEKYRLNAIPATGTYMKQNYAHEPEVLRYILEANAGIRLIKKYDVWLDAGVLPSPIGDENYFTFEQPTLSRSFVSEYTPYYLFGVKVSLQISPKIILNNYLVNGWQQIKDVNDKKSFVGHIVFEPTKNLKLNCVMYSGIHQNNHQPLLSNRIMYNVYGTFEKDKLQLAFNTVYINQQILNSKTALVYAANIKTRYRFLNKHFINARLEYYNDDSGVDVSVLNGFSAIDIYAASIGYDFKVSKKFMLRTEYKFMQSQKNVFNKAQNPINNVSIIYSGLVFRL